jgi:hypothetical protein
MLRSRAERGVSKHGQQQGWPHLSAEITPRDETRPRGPLLRVR